MSRSSQTGLMVRIRLSSVAPHNGNADIQAIMRAARIERATMKATDTHIWTNRNSFKTMRHADKATLSAQRPVLVRRKESDMEQPPGNGERITAKSAPPDERMVRDWMGPEAFEYWAGLRSWIDATYPGVFAPDWIRSEERRVGQECVSTCRSRWWPDHEKKKKTTAQ